VFEVVLGKNIGYADASGRYLLLGHLWDMTAGKDLTAEPKAALDKVDVQSLPVQMALHHKAGKGTRTLYVFADPMCGYCKQLEGALAEVDDVTVHTFVIPILGEESQRLATAIACSPDPAGSWRAWMREGKQPPAASPSCTPPIDELQRVARGAGVSATPTLVAADGRRFAGAMPAARLATWLAEGSLAQATAVTATVKTAKR
jgi:thiol:disulfide interchange protein DsbC